MPIDLSVLLKLEKKDPSLVEVCAKGMATPLSDEDVNELVTVAKENPYLKSIILWDGNITSLGAKLIADNLQFLEKIDLSGNKIDYAGLIALCNMPHLKELTLIGNNLFELDLSMLQSNNDDLKVILSNSSSSKTVEPIVFSPARKKKKFMDSETTSTIANIGILCSQLFKKIDPNATLEDKENFILEIREQLDVTLKNIYSTQPKSFSNPSKLVPGK